METFCSAGSVAPENRVLTRMDGMTAELHGAGYHDLELAAMIDHTLLSPAGTDMDVERICREAVRYSFASVCVHPSMVPIAKRAIGSAPIPVCTVIGFPLGTPTTETKVAEAKQAVDFGATEFDMVMHIGRLRSGDHAYVEEDVQRVVRVVREQGGSMIVKVILETCLLSDDEKTAACRIVQRAGADFVKTSTGFSTGGATEHDVVLLRATVGPAMGVKASGGIRTREAAMAMLRAGATRIGASASVEIVTL